jgi:hypothetical protein
LYVNDLMQLLGSTYLVGAGLLANPSVNQFMRRMINRVRQQAGSYSQLVSVRSHGALATAQWHHPKNSLYAGFLVSSQYG